MDGFALAGLHSYFGRDGVDTSIAIRVNGEQRRVPAGLSVAGMLGELGLDPRKVAVERNLEIVPRASLDEVLRRGRRRV